MIEIDQELRMRVSEASEEIVEPFRRVVEVAMRRVREGRVDNINGQRITLLHETGRIYLVYDYQVLQRQREDSSSYIISDGDLTGGLFIYGIQLDENATPTQELISIQIPRDANLTTKESLDLLRGSNPKDVERLASELESARVVEDSQYDLALNSLQYSKVDR